MDNYYQNCPPKMEDQGRHLSDFRTSTRRDEYIKYINDITRDDQYRLFLQLNGKRIMDNEWHYNKQFNRCWDNDCVHKYPLRTSNMQFAEEMNIYNSIYDMNTNQMYAKARSCPVKKDYRMIC